MLDKLNAFLKGIWDAIDIVKFLVIAFIVLFAWQVMHGGTVDETLKNIIIAIVSFYFGSSLGSKTKEVAQMKGPAIPPAA